MACIFIVEVLDLYLLERHHLFGIGNHIINLRWSSDHLRFMMGIPIPTRLHGLVNTGLRFTQSNLSWWPHWEKQSSKKSLMFLFCKHFTQLFDYFGIILDKGWFSDIMMTISSCPHHCTYYWFGPFFSEITITSVPLINLQCNWNTNYYRGAAAREQLIKYARYCDTTSIKNSIPQLGLNHSEQHRCRTESVL